MLRLIERLNQVNRNVAALLIPAVTLGCVEFKEIDREGNFVFVRNHKEFEPREVDQPPTPASWNGRSGWYRRDSSADIVETAGGDRRFAVNVSDRRAVSPFTPV